MIIFSLIGIALSLSGLCISLYLWQKKRKVERPFCPLRADCHTVIQSSYSKFFGISVESLGALYYFCSILFYIFLLYSPIFLLAPTIIIVWFICSILAVLFSLYLLGVQFFKLHAWCSWCTFSAFISILLALINGLLYFYQ
jgi:uncharacterized membrane protein